MYSSKCVSTIKCLIQCLGTPHKMTSLRNNIRALLQRNCKYQCAVLDLLNTRRCDWSSYTVMLTHSSKETSSSLCNEPRSYHVLHLRQITSPFLSFDKRILLTYNKISFFFGLLHLSDRKVCLVGASFYKSQSWPRGTYKNNYLAWESNIWQYFLFAAKWIISPSK